MVLAGCLTANEAYEAVQWHILMLIFAMLAVGLALEQTGAMNLMVKGLSSSTTMLGPIGLLIVVYVVTSIATEFMSNNAAAILLTPIAIGAALSAGLVHKSIGLVANRRCETRTAGQHDSHHQGFWVQTGGYRFTDFLRVGIPLNVICWITSCTLIPMIWPF